MKQADQVWSCVFNKYKIYEHDFSKKWYNLTAKQIKEVTGQSEVKLKEPRILCKFDTRENRPQVFKEKGLFILPIKNGEYAILQGEGYVNIPEIEEREIQHEYKLGFELETSKIGNSEMQHLDFAFASSMIKTFLQDDSLVLTIRGRKYTPEFAFYAGVYKQLITAKSVQTEVDAGYEAKNSKIPTKNVTIRQLYYPFRQWQANTKKKVSVFFFEKRQNIYAFWQFGFEDKKTTIA